VIKSKLVLLNKDRDKPKKSAFKCPTFHIQTVRLSKINIKLKIYYGNRSFGNKKNFTNSSYHYYWVDDCSIIFRAKTKWLLKRITKLEDN